MARPTFPKTLREFRERFATESACLNYFWESRWTQGFRCPQCGSGKAWPLGKRRVWECQGCGLQISPTAGTLLHRSHFPSVSYTHLRAHETDSYLVCRLLLEK